MNADNPNTPNTLNTTETTNTPAAHRDLQGARCVRHEAPAAFACKRCGDFACLRCEFAPGNETHVCAKCAEGGLEEPIPWQQQHVLGRWRAFWKTTSKVLSSPTRTFRTPSLDNNVLTPVSYGVLAYAFGNLAYWLLYMCLVSGMVGVGASMDANIMDANMGNEMVGAFAGMTGFFCCMMALVFVMIPIQALTGIAFSAALSHGTLFLLKAPRKKFEDTMRAVSWANAPYVTFPLICTAIFIPFWVAWLEMVAIREIHETTTGQAMLATWAWRMLLLTLFGLFYALIFFISFRQGQMDFGSF